MELNKEAPHVFLLQQIIPQARCGDCVFSLSTGEAKTGDLQVFEALLSSMSARVI